MNHWNFGIPHQPRGGLLLLGPALIWGFPSEGKGIVENLSGSFKRLLNRQKEESQPLRRLFPGFAGFFPSSPEHPGGKRDFFPRSQIPHLCVPHFPRPAPIPDPNGDLTIPVVVSPSQNLGGSAPEPWAAHGSHISCLALGEKVGKAPAMRSRAGRTPRPRG